MANFESPLKNNSLIKIADNFTDFTYAHPAFSINPEKHFTKTLYSLILNSVEFLTAKQAIQKLVVLQNCLYLFLDFNTDENEIPNHQ